MAFLEKQERRAPAVAVLAGVAMAAAGLLHLALAPTHVAHSTAHALALYSMGVIDLGWFALWLHRPGSRTAWLGMFLAGLTLTLYAITRFLPLPFEGQPEALDPAGLITQGFEALAFTSLVALGVRRGAGPSATVPAVEAAGLAIGTAWVVYGAATLASLALGGGP